MTPLFSRDVVSYLAELGLGTYRSSGTAGTLFRDYMPATPNEAGWVIQTGGAGHDMSFGSREIRRERPSASIQFRGEPYDGDTPMERAYAAYNALARIENEPVNGTVYIAVQPLQPPSRVAIDDQQRHIWGFNVLGDRDRLDVA